MDLVPTLNLAPNPLTAFAHLAALLAILDVTGDALALAAALATLALVQVKALEGGLGLQTVGVSGCASGCAFQLRSNPRSSQVQVVHSAAHTPAHAAALQQG